MNSQRQILAIAGAALLLLPVAARAKDLELPSSWRMADVLIDGVPDEWAGKLVPLGSVPIDVGIQNDGSFLYLCLKTSDEATKKKILSSGLSFYLDRSGKEDRAFGIRFPVGRGRGGGPDVPVTDDPKLSRELDLSVAGARLEVLGREEADVAVMNVADARPVEAALGEAEGALVVELRVPLSFSADSPNAVDARPGATIALGLDTAPPKVKRGRGDDEESWRGGGGGGMGWRGPGMGGGRGARIPGVGRSGGDRSPERRAEGKPIRAWVKVTLAASPKP